MSARRKSLLWQFYPITILVVMAAFYITGRIAGNKLEHFFRERTARNLEAQAHLVASHVRELLQGDQESRLQGLCQQLGEQAGTRITVITKDGKVLADSDAMPSVMKNHADRPEMIEALAGREGRAERYSETINEQMLYVALPVLSDQEVAAVVRTAQSLNAIDAAIGEIKLQLAAIAAALALALLIILYILLRQIASSLEALQSGAQRFANGELQHRLPRPEINELQELTETLNIMASQLDERIQTVAQQRNERDAMLASMIEGVLAVDREERILQINRAAIQLTGVADAPVIGRYLSECVRIPGLQRAAQAVLSGQEFVEAEVPLPAGEHDVLLVHGAALHDAAGKAIGALLVMSDISRLRKLERIRRDFVANVSHELKTPLTSIQGFVETLLEGALEQPENAQRFLKIIRTHADRLYAIVEDLLSLARIEEEVGKGRVETAEADLREVIHRATEACSMAAGAKAIQVQVKAPEKLFARVNAALMEQAVVNLIDNAIKYSEPKTVIEVELLQSQSRERLICVRDQGCGIEAHDLERIFERFYRVDKSRSRKAGGTGLGLSIVKHIVTAHGGRISVESRPGKGSIFTISLRVD